MWTRGVTSADANQQVVQGFAVGYVGHTGALRSKSTLTAIKWPRGEHPGSAAVVAPAYWVGTSLWLFGAGGGPFVSNPSSC